MSDPTQRLLSCFESLNEIPRCSKNETGVRRWLQQWADSNTFDHQSDQGGNLVVRIPPTPGFETAPTVILQGHMDMVCEKTPDSGHNFEKDPILSHREGDWVTAGDTTLGADNGIAIAYMLVLAEDPDIKHPPLELLFTVDEETGLNGAKLLEPGFVEGRILINLDSEDEGVFTIGCAGGVDTTINLDSEFQPLSSDGVMFCLVVGGLKGGHSGIDIHKKRANANRIMARVLSRIQEEGPAQIVSMHGGSRKNAIPRDARATFGVAPGMAGDIASIVTRMEQIIQEEYGAGDPGIFIKLEPVANAKASHRGLSPERSEHLIQLLLGLPDGVAHMSTEFDHLVETSSNLATVSLDDSSTTILSSQRSALESRLEDITATVHSVAQLAGANVEDSDVYPPWQPDTESVLLALSKKAYQEKFGSTPVIQVIHAGLECAIIGDIYSGMDMISFGPTIRNPHSPDERMHVPSVEKVWIFLVALLGTMKD